MIGSLRFFFKTLDLGFESLEVLLFAFAEGSLCGSVLSLAFLQLALGRDHT